MSNLETLRVDSAASIPGYELLRQSFREWVPMTLEIWSTEEKLQELGKIEASIRGMNPPRAEFSQRLEASWESYRRRHVERIAKFLAEAAKAPDPLCRGDRLDFLVKAFVPFEFFEEALALVPHEVFSAVQNAEREAELSKIRAERQRLKNHLKELRCPPYLTINAKNGQLEDLRERFFQHWNRKQSACNASCTAQGLALRGAPADEVEAFERLGLSRFINSKSRGAPAPRD